jgi:hypothetical protein
LRVIFASKPLYIRTMTNKGHRPAILAARFRTELNDDNFAAGSAAGQQFAQYQGGSQMSYKRLLTVFALFAIVMIATLAAYNQVVVTPSVYASGEISNGLAKPPELYNAVPPADPAGYFDQLYTAAPARNPRTRRNPTIRVERPTWQVTFDGFSRGVRPSSQVGTD